MKSWACASSSKPSLNDVISGSPSCENRESGFRLPYFEHIPGSTSGMSLFLSILRTNRFPFCCPRRPCISIVKALVLSPVTHVPPKAQKVGKDGCNGADGDERQADGWVVRTTVGVLDPTPAFLICMFPFIFPPRKARSRDDPPASLAVGSGEFINRDNRFSMGLVASCI